MSNDPGNWIYVTVQANDPSAAQTRFPGIDAETANGSFTNILAQPIRFPYGSDVQVALYKLTYQLKIVQPTGDAQNPSDPLALLNPDAASPADYVHAYNTFFVSSDAVASNQLVGSQLTTTLRKVTLEPTLPINFGPQAQVDTTNPSKFYDLVSGNPWINSTSGAQLLFDTADLGDVAKFRRLSSANPPVIYYYEPIHGSQTHFNVYNTKPIVGQTPDFVHNIDENTYVLGGILSPTNTPDLKDTTVTADRYSLPGNLEYSPQELRWVACGGSELTSITTAVTDDTPFGGFTNRFSAPISLTYVFRLINSNRVSATIL